MKVRAALLVATCLGAGYAPLAPGTAGAAVGLIPALLLNGWTPAAYGAVVCGLFLLGVAASRAAEASFGESDSPRIVIDEAVSMMITLAGISLGAFTVIGGFVLNRFFDIVKPFPARRLERMGGGWGVMLDDVVAGVYGNIVLRVLCAWWRGS